MYIIIRIKEVVNKHWEVHIVGVEGYVSEGGREGSDGGKVVRFYIN